MLEIIEDVSGSPIFPFAVRDSDTAFGETICRFRIRENAQLFVRAKALEGLVPNSIRDMVSEAGRRYGVPCPLCESHPCECEHGGEAKVDDQAEMVAPDALGRQTAGSGHEGLVCVYDSLLDRITEHPKEELAQFKGHRFRVPLAEMAKEYPKELVFHLLVGEPGSIKTACGLDIDNDIWFSKGNANCEKCLREAKPDIIMGE